MLIECVLAIIAIITAAYLTGDKFGELMANGGPIALFSDRSESLWSHFPGIPKIQENLLYHLQFQRLPCILGYGYEIGTFYLPEYFEKPEAQTQSILTNKYVATVITVVAGCILAVRG